MTSIPPRHPLSLKVCIPNPIPNPNPNTLVEGMHPDIHVLSMQCRDAVTDDVVLRLHNLGSTKHRIDLKVGEEGRVVSCMVQCAVCCL